MERRVWKQIRIQPLSRSAGEICRGASLPRHIYALELATGTDPAGEVVLPRGRTPWEVGLAEGTVIQGDSPRRAIFMEATTCRVVVIVTLARIRWKWYNKTSIVFHKEV